MPNCFVSFSCSCTANLASMELVKLEAPLSSDESRSNTVKGYHVKDVRF
jgi:hypothetical protein